MYTRKTFDQFVEDVRAFIGFELGKGNSDVIIDQTGVEVILNKYQCLNKALTGMKKLKSLTFINCRFVEDGSTHSNCGGMFKQMPYVTKLVLENVVFTSTSNRMILWRMCSYNRKLRNVVFNNVSFGGDGVEVSLANMFEKDEALERIDFINCNMSNVYDMSSMFYWCSKLKNITVPRSNVVNNMCYMFYCCFELQNVVFEQNFNTSNVSTIMEMFYSCNKLVSPGVDNFTLQNCTCMTGVFGYCKSLTDLNLRNWVTTNVRSMERMFSNCKKLKNLIIDNFVTLNCISFSRMFEECNELEIALLSNFEANAVNIDYMFHNCHMLNLIVLPKFKFDFVRKIDSFAEGCDNLEISNIICDNKYRSFVTSMLNSNSRQQSQVTQRLM